MIADDYRDPLPIRVTVVVTRADCISGTCDCDTTSHCKFPRCPSCDNILSPNGKAFSPADPNNTLYECYNCGGDTR